MAAQTAYEALEKALRDADARAAADADAVTSLRHKLAVAEVVRAATGLRAAEAGAGAGAKAGVETHVGMPALEALEMPLPDDVEGKAEKGRMGGL